MLFEKFIKETKAWWSKYFELINHAQKNGQLKNNERTVLYPTMILFTNFPDHYTAELIGASPRMQELSIKLHKEKSIGKYLNQFDDKCSSSAFHFDGALTRLRFLTISTELQLTELKERFPQIDLYKSIVTFTHEPDCPISFGENFVSAAIENSLLINKRENLYRCKNILSLYIFSKKTTKGQVLDLYNKTIEDNVAKGIHTVDSSEIIKTAVSQLQNMYLQPGLRETTIGEFIKSHPEIIKLAFNAKRFIYEPSLEWLEHDGTCEDRYINPDLMVENQNGEWDIYDLKTARLDKTSLIKDDRKRRRFIDYVAEGIAQLANYREYFSYPKNQEYARDKFGISVFTPKMVLVVGSWDNLDPNEVIQASRQLDRNIDIIDYDTFAQLILGGAKQVSELQDSPN